jgi:glycosyltransferase involved in cell wall biosynthesis
VVVFNRSRPSNADGTVSSRWRSAAQAPSQLLEFLRSLHRNRPSSCYLALSGGLGQLIDVAYVLLARTASVRVFVHHHSFAYLNRPKLVSRLTLRALRSATHIVLCEKMAGLLGAKYAVPRSRIAVVSNAAFLADGSRRLPVATRTGPRKLVLGFLSNITEDKGIFVFFQTLSRVAEEVGGVEGLIAGPVDASISDRFAVELAKCGSARHIGAVNETERDRFFEMIDFLLFPSHSRNEAEPLVVLEALRAGVPVIATAVGCLAEMVPRQSGWIVPEDDRFDQSAADYLIRAQQSATEAGPAFNQAAFVAHRNAHLDTLGATVRNILHRLD